MPFINVVKNDKIRNPFPITSGLAVANEGQELAIVFAIAPWL